MFLENLLKKERVFDVNKTTARILGGVLLGVGIIALCVSVFCFVTVESALSVVLLLLSMIANVAGIMFLGYTPPKKKK